MANPRKHFMVLKRQKASALKTERSAAGFSLIELLITIAIILIIAAIAIPSFLRSKIAANEASAAQNVRTLITASSIYNQAWGNGYPPALSNLGGPGGIATCDQSGLVDPLLATAPYTKGGYVYAYMGQSATVTSAPGCGSPGFWGYVISAVPQSQGLTGNRSFCADEQGVIHFDLTGGLIDSDTTCEALPPL